MSQEFNLIDEYFLPLSVGLDSDELGIGDDGAILTPPAGHQLVVVTDTMVEGVHFPLGISGHDIAWKAVAVNLSDLAAMGATPAFISLGLTLAENDSEWLKSFASGLADICTQYQIALVGGDTTKGPLTITVTAHGWVEYGKAILRSGAQEGDIIAVSGTIGDAGLGLKVALNQLNKTQQAWLEPVEVDACLQALHMPRPQIDLGNVLLKYASSAIDISDGLLADLGHILEQSNKKQWLSDKTGAIALQTSDKALDAPLNPKSKVLGADVYLDALPLSNVMKKWIKQTEEWRLPLSAGDDYQLCFTVSEDNWSFLQKAADKLGCQISAVGRITLESSLVVKASQAASERAIDVEQLGYQHF